MSRYKFNKIYSDNDGNRYRTSTIYNNIPYNINDQFIEVGMYERLENIAYQFYGNRDYWWIIAAANNIGKGTTCIMEGGVIRLPANPQKIMNDLKGVRY